MTKGRTPNPEYHRRHRLRKFYGMTIEEYDALLAAQGGVCAICLNPPTDDRQLVVDHDHETNEVRGLLCDGCNTGLGRFFDSVDQLRVAINYLLNPPRRRLLGVDSTDVDAS